ncbi:iron complex transport system substrate-binding protein [Silvibacterium bohemicum]|uniref:Iron complex transport system substrate-binding protein n=1 Tax=Silvibacterium bohemicum TaxID=1577686 RepID=A0A841JTY0_9BACT|nr:ABC transporter substrate-binding protein [Silvibacterium bohemicum]MBB6144863.1 iron complex transport system substrate-binding protein [Silvibacterium bohemicum]
MKIISLQPSISLILDRLGALDSLTACTRYCLDAVPALRERNLAIVHDSWSTRADELMPVAADLIVASVPYRQESLAAILRSGRPVLALAPHSLADIYQDIRLIASVVDATSRGEALVTEMESAVAGVRARTAGIESKPVVYCEEWGKPLIHSQLWVKELVEAAGGIFLGEPGTHTQPEAIAEANPDIFLAAWCGAGDRVPLEKIVQQRGWEQLDAVQNRRVYCIADELLNTPGPNLLEGLQALAQAIHPDVFGTITTAFGRQIEPHVPAGV